MEPDRMCKQNGLLLRGSAYFLQAQIANDCIAFFPKAVIRENLTATTGPEPKAQVRQKWADLNTTFERISATGRPYKHTLTGADAQHMLAALVASHVVADAMARRDEPSDDGIDRLSEGIAAVDDAERRAAARGDIRGIQKQTTDWLNGYQGQLELRHKRDIIKKITFDIEVPSLFSSLHTTY